jgi:ATP/maltotriose-dependent transcriptional regulator MalT
VVNVENAKTLQPHQQRVVDEKSELDGKRDRLTEFLKGNIFRSLPSDEQERLTRQVAIMEQYSGVLAERIAHF